jgi:hypothetical protein
MAMVFGRNMYTVTSVKNIVVLDDIHAENLYIEFSYTTGKDCSNGKIQIGVEPKP